MLGFLEETDLTFSKENLTDEELEGLQNFVKDRLVQIAGQDVNCEYARQVNELLTYHMKNGTTDTNSLLKQIAQLAEDHPLSKKEFNPESKTFGEMQEHA